MRKVAFITGATRGIGKVCAAKLAQQGWDVAIAARSGEPQPNLPGTIHTVAEELSQYGTKILPVQCNVRDLDNVTAAAEATLGEFGRIDAVINNAGALWWKNMDETPMNRYNLVMEVNVRGSYAVTEAFLPAMKEQQSGHVITMSPPLEFGWVPGRIAYAISKIGMTMIALGLAEEMKDYNIKASALWPKTLIESYATINWGMGNETVWRKADIIADAAWEVLQHPELSNGKALIDEDFLRDVGYTDFDQYLCVDGGQPAKLDEAVMRISSH